MKRVILILVRVVLVIITIISFVLVILAARALDQSSDMFELLKALLRLIVAGAAFWLIINTEVK